MEVGRGCYVTCGPAGSGKSSLIRQICGLEFDSKYKITGGADISKIHTSKSGPWKIIHEVRKELKARQKELSRTDELRSDEKLGDIPSVSNAETAHQQPEKTSKEDELQRLEERLKRAEDVGITDHEVTFYDLAGQRVYNMTHQIFMPSNGVYIYVTDLSKDLDDVCVDEDGKRTMEGKTSRESICNWINSIHTRVSTKTDSQYKFKPSIVIAGTKIDKITKDRAKVIKERKKAIYQLLTKETEGAAAYLPAEGTRVFAISNKPVKEVKGINEIEELKEMLLKLAQSKTYKVPDKWVTLELTIKRDTLKKDQLKMNRKEVYRVGKDIGLSEKDVDEALAFFHTIRDIIHFADDEELGDAVITHPQRLVDLFRLVITAMSEEDEVDKNPILPRMWARLFEQGVLDVKLVEEILKKDGQFKDKKILLHTFKMFDIIIPKPGTNTEYYMMCLLKKAGEEDVLSPKGSESSSSLYYHFRRGFLPDGFFHQLVIRCLKKWQYAKLYQDDARFPLGNHHYLIMSIKASDIKLSVMTDKPGDVDPSHGPEVRQYVEEQAGVLVKRYNPGLSYAECLRCDCGDHNSSEIAPEPEVLDGMDDGCVEVKHGEPLICYRGRELSECGRSFWYHEVERKRTASPAEEISPKRSRGNVATTSYKDTTVFKEQRFNEMLINLRDKMGNQEFIKLKEHCHDVHILKGTLEKKENAYDIFVHLKELGKITIDDTKLLEELLKKIGRTDLVTIVEEYYQIQ